ncbi:MAG: LamG domain-containing protein, partial [Verrucomicrobiota bacterium]|nr:LamG domain-containing protein [Verrucomicrobiota bacterium]
MQKKPIIIISVLCVISLVLGYLSGMKDEERLSNGDAETNLKKEPEFLKEGLVAYYPFNGNAKDESGNGHDGKIDGPIWVKDRHGELMKAFSFDGSDDEILVDHTSDLNAFPLSVSVWFNKSEKQYSMILAKMYDGERNGYLLHARRTGKVELSYFGTLGWSHRELPPSTGDLADNEWHNIVFTVNKKEIVLYVDGQDVAITPIIPHELSNSPTFYPLRIGSYNGKDMVGNYFLGQLDDIRIY